MEPDSLPPDCKLGATSNAHCLWDSLAGKQLFKGLLVYMLACKALPRGSLSRIDRRPYGQGTAQGPVATEVDVAFLLKVAEAEALKQSQRIVVGVVVMPLESLCVMEEYVRRK